MSVSPSALTPMIDSNTAIIEPNEICIEAAQTIKERANMIEVALLETMCSDGIEIESTFSMLRNSEPIAYPDNALTVLTYPLSCLYV